MLPARLHLSARRLTPLTPFPLILFPLILVALVACTPDPDADPSFEDPDLPREGEGGLYVGSALSTGDPVCAGDLAADTFRYGLCVCGDVTMAGHLSSASYTSDDPSSGEGLGGGIGANGSYRSAGNADIGGTLSVYGDYSPVGAADIAGELRVGGDLRAVGSTEVAHDAYVMGDVDSIGLEVSGTLHLTEEQVLPGFFVDAESTVVEEFTIAAPCGCDMAEDVVGFIEQAQAENDNDVIGLDRGALDGFAGNEDLTLPAGKYLLDGIRAAGDVHLIVEGPVALYVVGDIDMAGHLEVEMASDDASLDLFLGGDLSGAGSFDIGTEEAAARVRIYVAGSGDLRVAGNLDLGSSVYAPGASLTTAGDVEMFGAVVVGEVRNAGSLRIRYDAAVLDGGDCGPADDPPNGDPPSGDPPTEDPPNEDPPNEDPPNDDPPNDEPGGQGGECEDFSDCADPLVCVNGTCLLLDG